MSGLLLGYDVGSSSIKAAALDADSGACLASAASPERELAIDSPQPGWAEQDPAVWWEHLVRATRLLAGQVALSGVRAIGISYQMHGLVVPGQGRPGAAPGHHLVRQPGGGDRGARLQGDRARKRCLERLLNSPGNFTASKLAWVKENEPEVFSRSTGSCCPATTSPCG